MTTLKDKIAIVTGAASGFGAQIARRYVEQGAKVVIADLNVAAGEKLAAELGGWICPRISGHRLTLELMIPSCA